jgi:hypothetical protein
MRRATKENARFIVTAARRPAGGVFWHSGLHQDDLAEA